MKLRNASQIPRSKVSSEYIDPPKTAALPHFCHNVFGRLRQLYKKMQLLAGKTDDQGIIIHW
jgi:hypothetical protein